MVTKMAEGHGWPTTGVEYSLCSVSYIQYQIISNVFLFEREYRWGREGQRRREKQAVR